MTQGEGEEDEGNKMDKWEEGSDLDRWRRVIEEERVKRKWGQRGRKRS